MSRAEPMSFYPFQLNLGKTFEGGSPRQGSPHLPAAPALLPAGIWIFARESFFAIYQKLETQHLMNVDVVSDFKWMDKLEPNADNFNPMIQGLSLFCSAEFLFAKPRFLPRRFFALPN